MPHIRLVVAPEWEGLYINGTKVYAGEVVRCRDLMKVLNENLGYDAEVLQFKTLTEDDFKSHLRDFPDDTLPISDRI